MFFKVQRDQVSTSILLYFLPSSFLLYFGYELVRSPANVLFQEAYGVENLPLALAAGPICVALFIVFYTYLLNLFGPRRTLRITTLLSAFILLACYWGMSHGHNIFRAVLLIHAQSYIVLITEQYWSYLDSVVDSKRARVVNPAFIGMGSLGAIAGGYAVKIFAEQMGTQQLFIFTALALLPGAFFADLTYRKVGEPKKDSHKEKTSRSFFDTIGVPIFKKSPVLFRILGLVVLSQMISTVFGLSFQDQLHKHFGSNIDGQTAYSGNFYSQMAAISTIAQFALVPIVLRWIRSDVVLFSIPVVHLITATLLLFKPSLQTAAIAFMLYKSIDYSFFRVTKELLYVPLPFDARFRAKEVIDILGYRGSKGVTSLLIAAISKLGVSSPMLFPILGLFASVGWVATAIPVLTRDEEEQALAVNPPLQV